MYTRIFDLDQISRDCGEADDYREFGAATSIQTLCKSHESLRAALTRVTQERDEARKAIGAACGIIELGDQRLLASDGPAGGQPPDITLEEWRTMYETLAAARSPHPIEEQPT